MNRDLTGIVCALALLGGCGGSSDDVEIDGVVPDRGTLNGGTRVAVTGSGFAAGGAPPNIVLIGGGLASNVVVLDDNTIEATTPSGLAAGSVEVTIANDNGTASGELFTYNQPPTVDTVEPQTGAYTGGERVILRGSGFQAEGAGTPFVLIGGVPASDIEVRSDTEIALSAPNGRPLALADIEISNFNGGSVLPDAFRFVGTGLLALSKPTNDELISELFFVDVDNRAVFKLRNVELRSSGIGGLATSADGTVYGVLTRRNALFVGGQRSVFTLNIDSGEITVIGPTNQASNLTGLAFIGNSLYAVSRAGNDIGTIDLATGNFALSAATNLNAGARLAIAGGQAYLTSGSELLAVNPNTGVQSSIGPLTAIPRARAMAGIGEDLYVTGALSQTDGPGPTQGQTFRSVVSRLNRTTAAAQPIAIVDAPIEALTVAPEVF